MQAEWEQGVGRIHTCINCGKVNKGSLDCFWHPIGRLEPSLVEGKITFSSSQLSKVFIP